MGSLGSSPRRTPWPRSSPTPSARSPLDPTAGVCSPTPGRSPDATGWVLKPEGLCRDDVCVPVRDRDALLAGDPDAGEVDLAAFAAALGRPFAIDVSEEVIVLGEPAGVVAERLRSLEAPDVTLAGLDGEAVALSEFSGRKRILVTWASWCGCRYDLPAWQALHEELAPEGLEMVSISLDNEAGSAREWVDAAEPGPTFPVLLDPDHRLAGALRRGQRPVGGVDRRERPRGAFTGDRAG